jgi:hypothetical protein
VPEGGEFVVRVVGGTIWGASVLSFFKARSALFRQSLVDTRPPALLAVVLQFFRCLLQPKSSPLTGAWSLRDRGFVTPWAARDDHVSAVLGGVQLLQGIFWWRHVFYTRRLRRCFFPTTALVFGCFLVLEYRLYLIVCSVLDLAWSLLFSTDCL